MPEVAGFTNFSLIELGYTGTANNKTCEYWFNGKELVGTYLQTNFADIRFRDENDNAIPYYITGIDGTNYRAFLRMGTVGKQTVRMYFNNALGTAPTGYGNGTYLRTVFDGAADFTEETAGTYTGTQDLTHWNTINQAGTIVYTGTSLQVLGPTTAGISIGQGLIYKGILGNNYSVLYSGKFISGFTNTSIAMRIGTTTGIGTYTFLMPIACDGDNANMRIRGYLNNVLQEIQSGLGTTGNFTPTANIYEGKINGGTIGAWWTPNNVNYGTGLKRVEIYNGQTYWTKLANTTIGTGGIGFINWNLKFDLYKWMTWLNTDDVCLKTIGSVYGTYTGTNTDSLTIAGVFANGTVNLMWGTSTQANPKDFILERAIDAGAYAAIGTLTEKDISDTPSGGTAYYKIRSRNIHFNLSAYSNVGTVQLAAATTPPAGIGTIRWDNGSSGTTGALSWSPSGAIGYDVYKAERPFNTFTKIDSTASGTYAVGSLSADNEYWFYVVGTNAAGASLPSPIVNALCYKDSFNYTRNVLETVQTQLQTNVPALNNVYIGDSEIITGQLPVAMIIPNEDNNGKVPFLSGQYDTQWDLTIRTYTSGVDAGTYGIFDNTGLTGKIKYTLEAVKAYSPYWYISQVESSEFEKLDTTRQLKYTDIMFTAVRRINRT